MLILYNIDYCDKNISLKHLKLKHIKDKYTCFNIIGIIHIYLYMHIFTYLIYKIIFSS